MKHFFYLFVILLSASMAAGQTRQAQTQKTTYPSSGIRGYGFVDYFYNASNPDKAMEGVNAFNIRRVNLGYQYAFTRRVFAYSELEVNDQDLTGSGRYSIFLKQAFVELRNLLPQARLDIGLSPTPAVVTSTRIWGYRMLQKLPLDYYGLAPTVDNGIAMKGKIDPDGIVSYHVMVGNGTGSFVESNKTKRLYGSLGLTPAEGFTLEGYADYENAGNERYRATFRGLAGIEGGTYSIGLEGVYRINHHTITEWYDESPYALSLYGWAAAADDVRLVYRGDFYDPDQNELKAGMRRIEGIVGVDYLPAADVHIVPNIVYTTYMMKNSAAVKPSDALTFRLTAGFYFSSIK